MCDKTIRVVSLVKNATDPVGIMVQDNLNLEVPDNGADVNICCCKNDKCNNVNFASTCNGQISNDSRANFVSVYLLLFCAIVKLILVH